MKLLSVALLVVLAASAQTPPPPPPSIRTVGDATVTAQPDRAVLDLGVVSQAPTAQAAAAENARRLQAALREIKPIAGASAEIKTIGYSLSPDYRYPKQGGQPEIAGYTAHNTIEIATSDLAGIGRILDAATQAGANTVQRLQFLLKDDQAARAAALREAAQKARASADAIAGALGLRITRVLHVEQGGAPEVRPMQMEPMMMRAAAPAAPPTPVSPGTIEVRASVTLTVEIGQ